MKIKSIRQSPEYLEHAISYFQDKWATEESAPVYETVCGIVLMPEIPYRSGIF